MTEHLATLEAEKSRLIRKANPTPKDMRLIFAYDAAIALMRGQSDICAWQKDDDEWEGAHWDSACGEKYFFVEGGPSDNGHKFCHGCGKLLHIIEPKDPADEQ